MVFDKLGPSLYDFLRKNRYRPFSLPLVRAFGRQLLQAVAFLHSQQLVHTDLKPENVLLADGGYEREPAAPGSSRLTRVPTSSSIQLIDFGSATWERQHHSSVVSTRHYRAPEVILGLSWSYPVDLWSLGCILLELLTGDALFQTHENLEHLAMMERALGPIPASLAQRADRHGRKYFRPGSARLNWPEGSATRESEREVRKLRPLHEAVRAAATAHPAAGDAFAHLLGQLIAYEPASRLTADAALRHPFFTDGALHPPAHHIATQHAAQHGGGVDAATAGGGAAELGERLVGTAPAAPAVASSSATEQLQTQRGAAATSAAAAAPAVAACAVAAATAARRHAAAAAAATSTAAASAAAAAATDAAAGSQAARSQAHKPAAAAAAAAAPPPPPMPLRTSQHSHRHTAAAVAAPAAVRSHAASARQAAAQPLAGAVAVRTRGADRERERQAAMHAPPRSTPSVLVN